MLLDPAFVLSLLVGAFNTCMYLVIRGRMGWHVVGVLAAATLGAFAGQLIAERTGDVVWIGDFGLIWASAVAWLGIGVVVALTAVRQGSGPDDAGAGPPRPPRA